MKTSDHNVSHLPGEQEVGGAKNSEMDVSTEGKSGENCDKGKSPLDKEENEPSTSDSELEHFIETFFSPPSNPQ